MFNTFNLRSSTKLLMKLFYYGKMFSECLCYRETVSIHKCLKQNLSENHRQTMNRGKNGNSVAAEPITTEMMESDGLPVIKPSQPVFRGVYILTFQITALPECDRIG